MGITWPEVFKTGVFVPREDYTPRGNKSKACADGLDGWGLCMAGNKTPVTFGEGLLSLGKFLQLKGHTPEYFSAYANDILNLKGQTNGGRYTEETFAKEKQ